MFCGFSARICARTVLAEVLPRPEAGPRAQHEPEDADDHAGPVMITDARLHQGTGQEGEHQGEHQLAAQPALCSLPPIHGQDASGWHFDPSWRLRRLTPPSGTT